MSAGSPETPHPLPRRPNLRQLKDQAKDLLKSGRAGSLSDAQLQIARIFGFPSWPKLKARVEWLERLYMAFDAKDVERLRTLLNDQVKSLVKSRVAVSQADAHDQIARLFGLTNWDEVETALRSFQEHGGDSNRKSAIEELAGAIESNDLDRIKELMGGDAHMVDSIPPRQMYEQLVRGEADILLSGGRTQFVALKARVPWLDINQERHYAYAGYDGMVELVRQLDLEINSPVWREVRRPAPWESGYQRTSSVPRAALKASA